MIGIAMTTYNGEKYLKEQIDSILNQTVNDFELIVCDDVSSTFLPIRQWTFSTAMPPKTAAFTSSATRKTSGF